MFRRPQMDRLYFHPRASTIVDRLPFTNLFDTESKRDLIDFFLIRPRLQPLDSTTCPIPRHFVKASSLRRE